MYMHWCPGWFMWNGKTIRLGRRARSRSIILISQNRLPSAHYWDVEQEQDLSMTLKSEQPAERDRKKKKKHMEVRVRALSASEWFIDSFISIRLCPVSILSYSKPCRLTSSFGLIHQLDQNWNTFQFFCVFSCVVFKVVTVK